MKAHCLILFTLVIVSVTYSQSPHEKLLVVSYDGFRFDYLDKFKHLTPVLNNLKKSSTYAKCLINVFPTQTFPNHFSIATGVYAGVHGVLGSKVFDPDAGQWLKYGYPLFHYNKKVTPIWTYNEKAGKGRHSGVSMWPGSNFEYNGVNVTFTHAYDDSVPFEKRVSEVIGWFKHPKNPANFAVLYFEEPDGITHAFGPGSPQSQGQIKRVDDITQYILDSLKNNNLSDVNIVFLSDHGMEGVTRERIIDLRPIVEDISTMDGTSPVLQVYPKEGVDTVAVYNKLKKFSEENKHFKVYLRSEIPEHFQIKYCRRAPPILAVADPPYAFQDLYSGIDWYVKNRNATANGTYGVHGYDPNDVNMHPYFIAHGPAFKENFFAGELRTIDLFPMFAKVLGLKEPLKVKPNGTEAAIDHIFKQPALSVATQQAAVQAYLIIGSIVCITAIFATSIFCFRRRRKYQTDLENSVILEEVEAEKLLQSADV